MGLKIKKRMDYKYSPKSAFTLAETLIIILIIGIVAVLTLPILQTEVNKKVRESQKKTFNSKLQEGLRQMQINDALSNNYSSTDEFLSIMQNYFKNAKICSSLNLNDCFTNIIKTSTSEIKYNLATDNISKATDIGASESKYKNVLLGGIIFSDGTNALLAYRSGCSIADKFDSQANLKQCIAIMYDVNGTQGPNIVGDDIETINIGETTELDFEIGGVVTGNPMSVEECQNALREGAPTYNCSKDSNYLASAAYKCWEMEPKGTYHLISEQELLLLFSKVYGQTINQIGGCQTAGNLQVKDNEYWSVFAPYSGSEFFTSDTGSGNGHGYSITPTSIYRNCWNSIQTNAKGLCIKGN